MSIVVENLVKIYGSQIALDSVSFTADKGKVLGFLGPNGAGKSTTMKILSGYLPATSGKVSIAGLDIQLHSLKARSKLGYLPENNPLYPEMYVSEFLSFIAEIYKVKNKRVAVSRVIEQTGLEIMKTKKIGQLSKGYRQRVGLAQALLGDPEVLILDEPTTGLDPNQLTEIRKLIITLGEQKTVLLSTHIMQEVESICDTVIILNHGKIVANNLVATLLKKVGFVTVSVVFLEKINEQEVLTLNKVTQVEFIGHTDQGFEYLITTEEDPTIRKKLFDLAVLKNWTLLGLQTKETNLDDIFQNLTKA
jgi:ABC-2 type transport system ATP-binding protein